MNRIWKVIFIIILQLVLLTGLIGSKYYTLHYGEPVLLKTAPVDPWDMFRGEYVSLSYEISRVKGDVQGNFKDTMGTNHPSSAHVTLEKKKNDAYWGVTGIYKKKPEPTDGQIIVKASTVYYDSYSNEYFLTYGIESYYVEEGQGKQLEQLTNLDVVARIDRFGSAVIEKVIPIK